MQPIETGCLEPVTGFPALTKHQAGTRKVSAHTERVPMTDRRGETSRFDPRFDPAFQPGYDGAATLQGERSDGGAPGRGIADAPDATLSDGRDTNHRGADDPDANYRGTDFRSADRSTAEQRSADRRTADRRTAEQRTAEQRTAEQRTVDLQSGLAPSGSGPRPAGPPLPFSEAERVPGASGGFDVDESYAAQRTRSANPFLLVLWVASALMVFGGVALFQWVGQLTAEAQRTGSAPYDYFLVQSLIFGAPLLMVLGVATATGILFVHAVRWRKRR